MFFGVIISAALVWEMIVIKKQKALKLINIASILLCMILLLSGLIRTVISPDTEVVYENRPAEHFAYPSLKSYTDKSFQDSFESALSDQVHAAIKMKKLFNIIDTGCALPFINRLQDSYPGYIAFRDIYFYKDMLLHNPASNSAKLPAMRETVKALNGYFESAEDTDFFVYYIETDKDINYETGKKCGVFEYFSQKLSLSPDHMSRLCSENFEEYRENFLHTDHHWNGTGAYKAYLDICNMMGVAPLESQGLHSVDGIYRGTKAAGVEGIAAESFSVNIFDFPSMSITINGSPCDEYGMQAEFIANELSTFSYGSVFGPDCREIIFETGNPGKNLLIMGDSYDNAIIKSLASCFSKTCCIDLRAYDANSFELTQYIDDNDIDCVLFVGGMDYFCTTLY